MLRDLLSRFSRTARRNHRRDPAADDLWASVGRAPRPDSELVAQIEQVALDVYGAHGLPTRPGHYRWNPEARTWTFLGEHLTSEARWALLLERPPQAGWRYGILSDLGRTGAPDLAAAAALLHSCAELRQGSAGREGAGPWDEMELAIRLGAQWQALASRRMKAGKPQLRLTPPDATPGAAEPPKPSRRKPAKKA